MEPKEEDFAPMQTNVDEIADGIYRLSTWVPDVAPPAGFTFNQFLVMGDEPLLFHTGPRALFPFVSEAIVNPPFVFVGLTSASGPLRARSRIGISTEEHALLYAPTTPITSRSEANARAFATQRAQSNEPDCVVESSHD